MRPHARFSNAIHRVGPNVKAPAPVIALGLLFCTALWLPGPAVANTPVNQAIAGMQNSAGITLDFASGNMVSAYVDNPFAPNGIGTSYAVIASGAWIDSPMPPASVFGTELDPSVVDDEAGFIYAGYASYDFLPPMNANSGVFVSVSNDGGVNFGPPLPVSMQSGAPGTLPFEIKPKIEVDDFPQSPFHQRLHAIWERDLVNWMNSDAVFAWSPPGGAAWSAPMPINDNPGQDLVLWPDVAVGSDGRVLASWLDTPYWMPVQGNIRVDASLDGGITFGVDQTAATIWPVTMMMTDFAGNPTRTAMSYPSCEIDPSNPSHYAIAYAADPDVGTPVETRINAGLQPPGSGLSDLSNWQTAVCDAGGWVGAGWIDTRNTPWADVIFSRCLPPAGAWGPEVNVTAAHPANPGCTFTPPAIAASGNNVAMTWTIFGDPNPPPVPPWIHVSTSQDNGATWSPVTHVDAVTAGYGPVAAVDGNNIYVAWMDWQYPNSASIWLNRSLDGGATWLAQEVQVMATVAVELVDCSIAATGNNVYVSWTQRLDAAHDRDIYVAVSNNAGITWGAPVKLDTRDPQSYSWSDRPKIACTPGGNVYVAWLDESWSTGTTDATLARSTNYGATWQPEMFLGAGMGHSTWPFPAIDIACNANDVHVIYQSDRINQTSVYDIYVSSSPDGGTSWVESRVDTDAPETAASEDPRISVTGANVYAVWTDSRNGATDIYANQSTDGGFTWQPNDQRVDVGAAPGASGSWCPQVTSNATGPCYVYLDGRTNWPAGGTDVYAHQANGNGPDEGDIFYVESLDGGITWSVPLRVNDDATITDQSHPWLDIKPNGTVDVVWLDNRNDPANDLLIDTYMAALLPGSSTFNPNQRVSNMSFPPATATGAWMGDYTGIDVDAAMAHMVWPDTRVDAAQADVFYNLLQNPSSPNGACCLPASGCVVVSGAECMAQGGQFLGEGTGCDPNPCIDCTDHNVNACTLTMTNQGILGFMDGTQAEGSGFVYPPGGENLLFVGGLWVAEDNSWVDNRDYDADPSREWEVSTDPNGHCEVIGAGDPDQNILSMYTDQGVPGSLGLFVKQHSTAWAYPGPVEDIIIIHYTLTNESPVPRDLFAGVFLDIDIDSYGSNEGGADPALGLAYMYDEASGIHAGVMALESTAPVANASLIHNPTFVYPNEYILDEDKFGFLSAAGSQYVLPASEQPDDYGVVASTGPFPLGPGEQQVVAFAILGGESLADLMTNAAVARQLFYQGWAHSEEPLPKQPQVARLLPTRPNPFRDATAIRFELPSAARVSLGVYDVSGRRLRGLLDDVRAAGHHVVAWDGCDDAGRAVAGGVYYLRLQSTEIDRSRAVIRLR